MAAAPAAAFMTHVPAYTLDGSGFESFGFSVSGLGDINGDGASDLIVGALDNATNGNTAGSAYVYSGSDGTLLRTLRGGAGDQLGISVSGLGDVDGDGLADYAVGANREGPDGTARVYSGGSGSLLYTLQGSGNADSFGWSITGIGDVDNDGLRDVALGSPFGGGDNGEVRIVNGQTGSTIQTLFGTDFGGLFGFSVSDAGDIDGDGFGDLLIGAPRTGVAGKDTGSISVRSGQTGVELYRVDGETQLLQFGFSVSGGSDVNGDGVPDLVVGANVDDELVRDGGSVRVLSGVDGSELFSSVSGSIDGYLGQSVANVGDVNGDGLADVLAGSPGDDENGFFAGAARLLSGADGSVLQTFLGDNELDQFGRSVASAGDINGDSLNDLIIGADRGGPQEAGFARVFVSRLLGDADADGDVDLSDFTILRNNFGGSGTYDQADFDQNGIIDLADFTILRNFFGTDVNSADLAMVDAWAASVPEPAVAGLAVLGVLGSRRRR
jgi:hypothetical protein